MYTNSSLVQYVDLSPWNYGHRKAINGITIHHMGGNMSVETCGQLFHRKKGNSNYGIGTDGRIALYVEEKNGAYTSNSKENDINMITIEVANCALAPYWPVSPEALTSLINLCADICRRNGISKLIWNDLREARIKHTNGANMTLHRDFYATACPGPTLTTLMPAIADAVNMQLTESQYVLYGYDYSPVFDPEYYANRYADLKSAFGLNKDALWLHFQQFGMNEFRRASAEFDPIYYRDNNPDVFEAFKDDYPSYYLHYVMFGKAEGRKGSEVK